MKKLMLTTALVAATAFGAAAQTAGETAPAAPAVADSAMVPAFLASDFQGMTLYTLDTEAVRDLRGAADNGTDGALSAERAQMRWTSSDTFLADRDSWESVGSIDDIVMTKDGEIRGILVDVGGFLGLFARTVMVDLDDLYFVADNAAPEDIDDFFVVVAMSRDQLEALPEWDDAQLTAGFEMRQPAHGATALPAEPVADTEAGTMPATDTTDTAATDMEVFDADFMMLEGEERTVDRLLGADVYDAHGENVGRVDDVVIGADNRITGVIVDVGGFLGIGAHSVELPIEDARIGWRDADGDVRVQVSMTADQLESLPEHEG